MKIEMEPHTKKNKEYQTTSVFVILAVLTVLFVLGFKWVVLTPPQTPPAVIEAIKTPVN